MSVMLTFSFIWDWEGPGNEFNDFYRLATCESINVHLLWGGCAGLSDHKGYEKNISELIHQSFAGNNK